MYQLLTRRGAPRHQPVAFVDALVVAIVHLGPAIDCTCVRGQDVVQALHDVVHFALREVDDAAVDDDVGVGAVEHEEVGEVRGDDAQVGTGVAVPLLVQIDAACDRSRASV